MDEFSTDDELREAAREAIGVEREHRQRGLDALKAATIWNPRSKVARRSSALMLDQRRFDEWVVEKGGVRIAGAGLEELKAANVLGFMDWFCGQVASRVTTRVLCEHYMVEEGLLGAFLSEDEARLERYYRAQKWVAEGLVEDTLEIAHGDGDVGERKLQVDTHMRVAKVWNKPRFGDSVEVKVTHVDVRLAIAEARSRVIEGEVVEQLGGGDGEA